MGNYNSKPDPVPVHVTVPVPVTVPVTVPGPVPGSPADPITTLAKTMDNVIKFKDFVTGASSILKSKGIGGMEKVVNLALAKMGGSAFGEHKKRRRKARKARSRTKLRTGSRVLIKNRRSIKN